MTDKNYTPGKIKVEGCVIADFLLSAHLPPDEAPRVIERDRLIMSARPGFNRKLLPLRVERETARVYSGGRYLFDTYENAVAYADWCKNEFAINGVPFFERPDFDDIRTGVFRVIGAQDFKDLHSAQFAHKLEVWKTSDSKAEDKLVKLWTELRDRAAENDNSSLWLLHNAEAGEVAMLTVIDKIKSEADKGLDYVTLSSIESAPSYAENWNWLEKTFERSLWIYTIWFPNTNDAKTMPALWPNSPPLPAP